MKIAEHYSISIDVGQETLDESRLRCITINTARISKQDEASAEDPSLYATMKSCYILIYDGSMP